MNFSLLDCTLRDGGYYTNWNFSDDLVNKYISTVSKLPIEIIEIGYISDNKDLNGPFYHLPIKFLKNLKKNLSKRQKIAVMVNAKEINSSLKLINLLEKYKNTIDVVRFAIDPKKLNSFLKKLKPAKKKFKNISFKINLMYLSKWHKNTNFIKNTIKRLEGNCDTVALVDSYGALKPIEVYNLFIKLPKLEKIKIGCHFHNNCGLALANTLSALEAGCSVADSTMSGMGRGAGNAETELLLAIFKSTKLNISNYEFDNLLNNFKKIKNNLNWGSSFSYAYAASMGYSQAKMMDLLQKKRLDTGVALKAISSKIEKNNQLKFDNLSRLNLIKKNIPILIGGAPSFKDFGKLFLNNLNKDIPIILSGSNALFNFLEINLKIKNPLILVLSGSEIKKINLTKNRNFFSKINLHTIIVEKDFYTQNIKKINKSKIVTSDSCALNPVLLTGLILVKLKCKKLYISNFDGEFTTEKGRAVMEETKNSIKILKSKKLKIESLNSTYLNVSQTSIWSNDKFFYSN